MNHYISASMGNCKTNNHRILVRRFPYDLLYSIGKDDIYIIAVMHLNLVSDN